jgi:alkanesulfonate monooxygenase SsuD/methylene tetrahydromethanopterin reductase-like flavin-dependent oxidoreductase (luciferase family)
MRFGLLVANIGSYADPRTMIRVAQEAERAGWELFMVWDHLAFVWGQPAADPWVTLAAVATSTDEILLGPGVTPVPRRRPQVVAHELATLDALSGGRVIFGAGLGGGHGEFRKFGESEDPRDRAPLLDEGLDVIRALLDGEEVTHHGEHFTVEGVTLKPAPGPRLPIWVGGRGRKSRERAARFDGWFADTADAQEMKVSPDELERLLDGYDLADVAILGNSEAGRRDVHDAYAEAGATWWIEQIFDQRGDYDAMLARIAAGP